MDTEDLYEGGRFKRKRYNDDDSEDDGKSYHDPDAYDSNIAKMRSKLIRSEFDKRKFAQSSQSNSTGVTSEEKLIAKTSLVKDPFNNKIQNLTIRSRDCWLKKIQQTLEENSKTGALDLDSNQVNEVLTEIEHDIFQRSKNLIIYQANSLKMINLIKKATKEKKSFLNEFKNSQNEKKLSETINELEENDGNKPITSIGNGKFKPPRFENFQVGFTNASNLLNDDKNINKDFENIGNKECDEFKLQKIDNFSNFERNLFQTEENRIIETKTFKELEPVVFDLEIKTEKIKISSPAQIKKKKANETCAKNLNDKEKKSETELKKLDLKKISVIVVTELTILYKSGKFSNKDVFKSLAKKLSHFLLDKQIDTEEGVMSEIKKLINYLSSVIKIQDENDYQDFFKKI